MKKIFLYLYPIKEFTEMFLFNDYCLNNKTSTNPLFILNSTINKRYRNKGYEVVFALYPDKELYGIEKMQSDRIIYTDITFYEASAFDENRNEKINFIPKYPNELYLLRQLGNVNELVVGGYHSMSCVKKVAEVALKNGINTLVDLDLTDLFFILYDKEDYFKEESYDPDRLRTYMINIDGDEELEFNKRLFDRNYESEVYGLSKESTKIK